MKEAGRTDARAGKPKMTRRVFGGDISLWVLIGLLGMLSLLVIYSSTASEAHKYHDGDTSYFLTKQFVLVGLSFAVVWIVHRINYQTYARFSKMLFWISIIFLCLTFFIGKDVNGAKRAIPLLGGFTFQPSDFVKVTLIMVLARELTRRQATIAKTRLLPRLSLFRKRTDEEVLEDRKTWRETTRPMLMPVFLACAIIFPSNFSTSAITFATCFVMLYIGRASLVELGKLLWKTLVMVVIAVTIMHALGLARADTWVDRLDSFAQSIGLIESTGEEDRGKIQSLHAQRAIATGGLIGKGPGQSIQRPNLPLSYSDFVFAFVVEEYGLLGGTVMVVLFLWLFFRTFLIFKRCQHNYPSLLVLGLGTMIVLQAFVSMMVAVGVVPVTGQPLPLISSGGSALVFNALALGMILGVSRQTQQQTTAPENEEDAQLNPAAESEAA